VPVVLVELVVLAEQSAQVPAGLPQARLPLQWRWLPLA
jgi:hypothetical protein